MAYSIGTIRDGLNFSGSSVGSIATSATVTVANGGWIFAWVYYFAAAVTVTVSDGTNSLTELPGGSPINVSNSRLQCFARYYATGGTFTITASFSSNVPYPFIVAAPVSGLVSTALVAAQCSGATQSSPGTGADAVTTGNATPQAQPAMQLALSVNDGSSDAPNAGTGFTNQGAYVDDGTGPYTRVESRTLSALTAVASTFTAVVNSLHLSIQVIVAEEPPPPAGASLAWLVA